MRSSLMLVAVSAALSLLGPLGCLSQKNPSVVVSSSGEPGYAARYPDELDGMLGKVDERQREARQATARFASYPDQLKDVKKDQALAVVERADEAGRSYAYVERAREAEQVQAFFRGEKEEINKKVGGAVQYAAKQKGASIDVYGTVGHSLGEAIDKQIEKRLRERNEAHAVIERYRVSLGKANAAALEKQADEISHASYILHVEAVTQKQLLEGMINEAPTVKKTADSFIQREKAFQAEAGRTDPEKKASEERIATMTRSKERIDASVEKARQALPNIDQQLKANQKEYADALAALKAKLR